MMALSSARRDHSVSTVQPIALFASARAQILVFDPGAHSDAREWLPLTPTGNRPQAKRAD